MELDVKHLKAAFLFVDPKYRYNSIDIQFDGAQTAILVATDGKSLLAQKVQVAQREDEQPFKQAIRFDEKLLPKSGFIEVNVMCDGSVKIQRGGVSINCEVSTRYYPDWKRIVPQSLSKMEAQFKAAEIKKFEAAAKLLNEGDIIIYCNGDNPAVVNFAVEEYFGLISPFKKPEERKECIIPEWISARNYT